jgi:hypothetical protein
MAAHTDNSLKQKAVIEFLMKEGIAAREISDRLKKVSGNLHLVFLVLSDGWLPLRVAELTL